MLTNIDSPARACARWGEEAGVAGIAGRLASALDGRA
jgi:hypothetical protein